jgi:hypothetical protein
MTSVLSKPSSLINEIQMVKVGTWNLFKFSESLQLRMETLLDKKKEDLLSPEDVAELDSIGELDSPRRGYANESLPTSMQ